MFVLRLFCVSLVFGLLVKETKFEFRISEKDILRPKGGVLKFGARTTVCTKLYRYFVSTAL